MTLPEEQALRQLLAASLHRQLFLLRSDKTIVIRKKGVIVRTIKGIKVKIVKKAINCKVGSKLLGKRLSIYLEFTINFPF